MFWAFYVSISSAQLICHSSAVWLLVMTIVSATGLGDLSGGWGTAPFIFIISPCILPYKSLSSPSLLTWFLSCVVSELSSHTCSLGSLSASACIAYINTSSSCPTAFLICSCKYCPVNMVVPHRCFVSHVVSLPVFVTQTAYECPLLSLQSGSTVMPCIHHPPGLLL